MRPISNSESVVLAQELARWNRLFSLSWLGVFLCTPYVILSVVGVLMGSPLFLNGGFCVGLAMLWPIVISGMTYRSYRDRRRSLMVDAEVGLVEVYADAEEVTFSRTPKSGLILDSSPTDYALATTVTPSVEPPGFPRLFPSGALAYANADTRALSESEKAEIRIGRKQAVRGWIMPTLVLGVFAGAMTGANIAEHPEASLLILVPLYCIYRWILAAQLSEALGRDLEEGLVVRDLHRRAEEQVAIEYLPNSRLIWTVEGVPSAYRSN